MLSSSALLTFVVATVVLAVVPGPSVLFIVGRALSVGRSAAVVLRNLAGVLVLVLIVSVGVGAFLQQMATALLVLKVLGGTYLIWLGWTAFRDRGDLDLKAAAQPGRRRSPIIDLRQGFTVGVTNPGKGARSSA